MLELMCTMDYRERPNAKDLLDHPFLTNTAENIGKRPNEKVKEKKKEKTKKHEEL